MTIDEKLQERLLSLLRAPRTTSTAIFKLNASAEQVAGLIRAAYEADVISRHRKYMPTPQLDAVITRIAQILTDGKFYGGILCCGTCGLGKTTLVSAMRKVLETIGMNCPGLMTIKAGLVVAPAMSVMRQPEKITELSNFPLLCIEDLGREMAEINDYGNRYSPIRELIERRYDSQRFTIITTNLTAKQITEKYGTRIGDRFNEMLEMVVFCGESFRDKRTINTETKA